MKICNIIIVSLYYFCKYSSYNWVKFPLIYPEVSEGYFCMKNPLRYFMLFDVEGHTHPLQGNRRIHHLSTNRDTFTSAHKLLYPINGQ